MALSLCAAASAQVTDEELDKILQAPDEKADGAIVETHEPAIDRGLGESELDILSHGSSEDPFPSLDAAPNRKGVAVTLRALNKVVARYTDIEVPIGEAAKFGALEIRPQYCDTRPPEEFPETTAFLEIFDRDLERARAAAKADSDKEAKFAKAEAAPDAAPEAPAPVITDAAATATIAADGTLTPIDPDRIFSGWMFASSPGLNPLEHSVYDVWVIGCKTVPLRD
jgi:hypothetical protein